MAEQITQLVTRHLAFIQKISVIPAILFSRELHVENDLLRQHFARLMTNRQKVFASLIARGIAQGLFRKDVTPKDAAILNISLVQGLAML